MLTDLVVESKSIEVNLVDGNGHLPSVLLHLALDKLGLLALLVVLGVPARTPETLDVLYESVVEVFTLLVLLLVPLGRIC